MSNAYGFQFLKSEHVLDRDGNPLPSDRAAPSPPEEPVASTSDVLSPDALLAAQSKPDLEKQYDILSFLKDHRGSGCLQTSVIYRKTGIDLDINPNVADLLQNNPKIRVEMVPDPENPSIRIATYAYRATYPNVRNRASLLAQINRESTGVRMKALTDSYDGVTEDIQALITAGDVIAVVNTEDNDKILFPRGDSFLVELDGLLSLAPLPEPSVMAPPPPVQPNVATNGGVGETTVTAAISNGPTLPNEVAVAPKHEHVVVETDVDPQTQVRRGEAVRVGGQWFRVSSAVKDGLPLSEQPARAQAPLSVTSLDDLPRRNELDGYIRPFDSRTIPLDGSLSATAEENIQHAKIARERLLKLTHGRTGGVTGPLLGSMAHSSNPQTLATSLIGGSASSKRKRPGTKTSASTSGTSGAASAEYQKSLEEAAGDKALGLYKHAVRHGCTKDIRAMYLETRDLVPSADSDLRQKMVDEKLLDPGEKFRLERLAKTDDVDEDGKKKKRRYYIRKGNKITNTHLEGTPIGAVLALAAERQRQGNSVGDGGM